MRLCAELGSGGATEDVGGHVGSSASVSLGVWAEHFMLEGYKEKSNKSSNGRKAPGSRLGLRPMLWAVPSLKMRV